MQQIKIELQGIIDRLVLDNIETYKPIIIQYLDFLEKLKELPVIEKEEQEETEQLEVTQSMEQPQQVTLSGPIFTFIRKLRGGIIPELEYLVSEKVIRELGLQHQDKVRIVSTIHTDYGPRYSFEIVEKGPGIELENRVQYDICIVEKEPILNTLMVGKHANGIIKVQEAPHTIILNQKDVNEFSIKEGDLVDISLFSNTPDHCRVIWKHDTNEKLEDKYERKSSAKKNIKEEPTDDDENNINIDLKLFKGKTIVIVGAFYFKSRYQQAFNKIPNCELIHLVGDEPKARMTSMIKNADVIVVTTTANSHSGTWSAREISKEYEIPFISVDREGINFIIQEVQSEFRKVYIDDIA